LKGRSVLTIVSQARVHVVSEKLLRIRGSLGVRASRNEYLPRDERAVSMKWPVSRYTGGDIVRLGRDVARNRQFFSKLGNPSRRDPVTDLPNRAECLQQVRRYMFEEKHHPGRTSLLLLGLNRFKDVNESFGYDVGDDILHTLGLRFKTLSASFKFIDRLGGDEFVFILVGTKSTTTEAFAQTLLEQVAQAFQIGEREIRLSGSIGIAGSAGTSDFDALLSQANNAMMAAKSVGGSLAKVYDPGISRCRRHELQLRFDLWAALERGEFVLHYQPKVSLLTGKITGAEALIRWRHPALGLLLPGEFIRIAEESPFIVALGTWVIEQALNDLGRWAAEVGDEFVVSINVSPRQLADPMFPSILATQISQRGVRPSRVEVEVTEGMLVDFSASECALREMRRMGVSIALDDFGTGYSSLSYVMRFPVNTIKIDRSFVCDLVTDQSGRARISVGAVIALCKSLGLHALAEGVETEEQKKALEEAGCDSIQGYLVSPALPAEAFLDFVKDYME
jgi:diguanylate cyclase (GGDEF)-like protein